MSKTDITTALIVDDEQLARQRIGTLLDNFEQIRIVGECSDGEEAIEAIRTKKPDIVFLDIQMPDASGFDVIQAIGIEEFPRIKFVNQFYTGIT